MKIVLVGYMASGKSSIGSLIAKELKIPFFDLDSIIENQLNLGVKAIFEEKGELFFRKKEREMLDSFLNSNTNYVLALGGGTPCYYDNYNLYLKETINSIYLKGSVTTIADRLHTEKQTRPLVANLNNEELLAFVGKHMFERNYFYHQAKTIVSIDDKNELEIVAEIIASLT